MYGVPAKKGLYFLPAESGTTSPFFNRVLIANAFEANYEFSIAAH